MISARVSGLDNWLSCCHAITLIQRTRGRCIIMSIIHFQIDFTLERTVAGTCICVQDGNTKKRYGKRAVTTQCARWSLQTRWQNGPKPKWATSWENLSYRPAQLQRLARFLKFWIKQVYVLYYLGSEQRRRWSDCADAQTDLCLCFSHMA